MWDKVKAVAAWVYHWITVLVALFMGALTVGVDYIDQLAGLDFTPIMDARHAAQVTFGVALAKAIAAGYNAKAKT